MILGKSIQTKIYDGLKLMLESITALSENEFDVTGKVHADRLFVDEDDQAPFLAFVQYPPREGEPPSFAEKLSNSTQVIQIMIQGWLEKSLDLNADNMEKIDRFKTFVKMALAHEIERQSSSGKRNILNCDGKVLGIEVATGPHRPSEESSNYLCFYVPIKIRFIENMKSPFS